jgi:hypothetical protein
MTFNIFSEKLELQKSIFELYGNPVMTKVKSVQNGRGSLSLYYARVGCMLCVDDRYIIAVVENDPFPVETTQYLSDLTWVSFQTRTLNDIGIELKSQQIPSGKASGVLNDKISSIEETTTRKTYECANLPVKVELLCNGENDGYADTGTVYSALETYSCVLSFTI